MNEPALESANYFEILYKSLVEASSSIYSRSGINEGCFLEE